MHTYVWSVKNKSGTTALRAVTAENAVAARALLLEEGCTNLVLKEAEIMEASRAGFPEKTTLLGQEFKLPVKPSLNRFAYRGRTRTQELLYTLIRDRGLSIFLLACAVLALCTGHQVLGILAVAALGLWRGFLFWLMLPFICFRRVAAACEWHQWETVLQRLERLRKLQRVHFIKFPAVDFVRMRATALAGLGRLPEALAEYQPRENQPGCPSWLHHATLAGIYYLAKRRDLALESYLKSLQESPTATFYIEVAAHYARFHKDPVKARAALNEAEKMPVPEADEWAHHRCRGLVSHVEGDLDTAEKEFRVALEILEANWHEPYRTSNLSVTKAYLSWVLAKLGRTSEAMRVFNEARRWLDATRQTELIADCETALAGRSG